LACNAYVQQYLTRQRISADTGAKDENSFVKQVVCCSLLLYGETRQINGD